MGAFAPGWVMGLGMCIVSFFVSSLLLSWLFAYALGQAWEDLAEPKGLCTVLVVGHRGWILGRH